MADLGLATKILGVLYDKYFQNHIIGILWRNMDAVVEGDKNEISKAVQLLENKFWIEKNQGFYRITDRGIDKYEEVLSASAINKRITERKIILGLLKELYDKDTSLSAEMSEILDKIQSDNREELWGQMNYLVNKGLVDWIPYSGGFSAQLTVDGAETFESYETHDYQIMTTAYRTFFLLENHIRKFIEKKLTGKYGTNWWEKGVSSGLRKKVDERKQDESKFPWTVSSSKNNLEYLSFPDLTKILINQWEVFKDFLKDQSQIELRLKELDEIRNSIGHSRTLTNESITRLEQYSDDVFKITKD